MRVVQFLRHAYERFASLVHELLKFGTVGAIAFVIDFGGANLLRFGLDIGPLKSKILSTVLAATFAYLGNRYWTYRHRKRSGLGREYVLFFLLNGVGLLPPLILIAFVTYVLGLNDLVSYNIAQGIGVVLGTLFRFWSYKRWVFLAVSDLPSDLAASPAPAEDVGDAQASAQAQVPVEAQAPPAQGKAQQTHPDPITAL